MRRVLSGPVRGMVGALVAAVLSSAAAQVVVPARYLLVGTLAGKQVQLELTLTPTQTTGTLLGKPPQPLQGSRTQAGDVHLEGKGVSVTGRLPEPFAKNLTFSGTLADGTPFELALAASYTVRRTEQGPFLETRSETPFWLVAPWRRLNGRLEHFVTPPIRSFIRDAQHLAAAGELAYPYTLDSTLEPTLLTDDTLSLLGTNVHYTGGAHSNTGYRSLTFYWTGQELRQLELADFFRKGAAYQEVLLQKVTAKLRARRAAWILDNSITLSARDLGVFNLTRRGLEFTFAPYAVGPYAQGKFAVTVPYKQLRGLLKPGLLP